MESIFKQVIENELEKRLNRKPTLTESDNAYADVIDNWGYTDALSDIANILTDYIANNYTKCEQCGEYHLNTDMQIIQGPEGWQKVCNNKDCELNAYTDVNYNKCREWATY